ncbi:MAG: PH domain-containing protein [Candidatus Micrarchaeia archaeon]
MERHLDPKVKILWMFPNIGLAVIVTLVLMGLYYATHFTMGIFEPSDWMFLIIPLLSLGIIGGLSYAWIHLHYVNFTYELADTEVIIRWGIFTRLRKVIPYARIQNINTERTVLERVLGIGSLMIETAGTQSGLAEGIIPGIANATSLIDEILHRVEKTKKGNGNGGGGLGDEAPKAGTDYSELLTKIHEELKSLNARMAELSSRRESFAGYAGIREEPKPLTPETAGVVGTGKDIMSQIERIHSARPAEKRPAPKKAKKRAVRGGKRAKRRKRKD